MEYDAAIADEICARITQGEPLARVCRADDIPCLKTVYRWMREQPEFRKNYDAARLEMSHALLDDALRIADESAGDHYEDEKGRKLVDHDAIARSRLRVDARLKLAEKLNPGAYGPKLQVPKGGNGPMQLMVVTGVPEPTADGEV